MRTSKRMRRIAAVTALAGGLLVTASAADAGAQANCVKGNSKNCVSTTTSTSKPVPTSSGNPPQAYCRQGLVFSVYFGYCESDSDKDGLGDGYEGVLGTNPANRDTDGDGMSDGVEVSLGYNPLSPLSPGNVCNPRGKGKNCF